MKKQILLLAFSFFTLQSFAQQLMWAKRMGSSLPDEGRSIGIDAQSNIYTLGVFSGTVDFDPGIGVSPLTSAGDFDMFISKMDSSGNLIWAKRIGNSNPDNPEAMNVDAAGNVYITGDFGGIVDFNPVAGTTNLVASGTRDIFVCKLNSSGDLVWAKSFVGTANDERGHSIAVDAFGNVLTTGMFSGTIDFDPGAGSFPITNGGGYESYISKLDSQGNFVWAKRIAGRHLSGIDFSAVVGGQITTDVAGNIYTAGSFQDTVDFDPGPGTYKLFAPAVAPKSDIYILKLSTSGNFIWAKSFTGNFEKFASSIAVDAAMNVYTSGHFQNEVNFNPGTGTDIQNGGANSDAFVARLDANGNFAWVKQMGGPVGSEMATSIVVDGPGNIYTTGKIVGAEGDSDFDPGPGTHFLSNVGFVNNFICQLNPNGDFAWAKNMGGPSGSQGTSIAVDGSGMIYTTGFFQLSVDFDPGPDTFSLTSEGESDVFITKFGPQTFTAKSGLESAISATVFPNPASGQISIRISDAQIGLPYSISDGMGRTVLSGILDRSLSTIHLNNSLHSGFYYLRVGAEGAQPIKLVKQ